MFRISIKSCFERETRKKLLDIYEEEREIVESILKESENRDNLKMVSIIHHLIS